MQWQCAAQCDATAKLQKQCPAGAAHQYSCALVQPPPSEVSYFELMQARALNAAIQGLQHGGATPPVVDGAYERATDGADEMVGRALDASLAAGSAEHAVQPQQHATQAVATAVAGQSGQLRTQTLQKFFTAVFST